jgi:hypothetical protein
LKWNCSQLAVFFFKPSFIALTVGLASITTKQTPPHTLKMEVTRPSETLVYNKPTWRHIPEDGILHSHYRENLKS